MSAFVALIPGFQNNHMIQKLVIFFKNYINRLNTGMTAPASENRIPETIIYKKSNPTIHILLFFITLGTTTMAGMMIFYHPEISTFEQIMKGMQYSLTIMVILLCHEFGHYFAAKKFGVITTLPYFIPFIPIPFGTMGAVIKAKTPIPNRRALLYIGAIGPLAGFIASLIAVIAGVYLSEAGQFPAGASGEVLIFGDSLLLKAIVTLIHGPLGAGYDISLTPYLYAGWFGFLITSLNLMPVGQLDGGHILYALIGRKQLYVGWITFGGLIALSFIWEGWAVWIILTLFILMIAHPATPEEEKLSLKDRLIGWSCAIIFIITFIPIPISEITL